MSTAQTAEPISGNDLYQIRARAALPILVRQAKAGVPICYSDLAEELGMPNPRNLNYVLGSIGRSLERVSEYWKEKIPPIQCLVVNKSTGFPGEGIGWFLVKEENYSALSSRQKRSMVETALNHIFTYSRWIEVLAALAHEPTQLDISKISKIAMGGTGGESDAHKALKEYVVNNPHLIGLNSKDLTATTEYQLLSGDSLDVSFESKKCWVAV